jgi:hypothetical protein
VKPDFRALRGGSYQNVTYTDESPADIVLTRRLKDWPVHRRQQCGFRLVVRSQT